jgi:hypothetical protein
MTMESTGLNRSYYNLDSMLQGHVQIRSPEFVYNVRLVLLLYSELGKLTKGS